MNGRSCHVGCNAMLGGVAVILCGIGSAAATTFSVTTTADTGAGSLRQAMLDANQAGGGNTIAFAIPGSGTHTIALASELPYVTSSMTIDGYSQPGSLRNTHTPDQGGLDTVLTVELDGGGTLYRGLLLGSANGIALTVQGLAIHGFGLPVTGTGVAGTSQLYVYGNFIGTTIDGNALPGVGNSDSALRSGYAFAQIGGVQPWQRNLLSGGGNFGVLIAGPAIVEGNLIGTDASGTQAIPNGTSGNGPGVTIPSDVANIRIGGVSADARNLISGNHTFALVINNSVDAVGVEIKGNYIGTDWSGLHPLPNGWENPAAAQYGGGIQVFSGSSDPTPVVIGGFAPGEANLIAYNRGVGIIASANRLGESFDSRANLIHDNHAAGRANLDIGAVGPTPNDADDADSGANDQQNWPGIVSATQSGNQLSVTYRVDSAPANSAYPLRVDFYADADGGSGQWLAQDSYTLADAQQARSIVLTLPAGANAIPFVATATNADGHTSEFSPAFDVIFEDDLE